jgi:hypothetical protein
VKGFCFYKFFEKKRKGEKMKKLILSILLVVLCMSLFGLDKWAPVNVLSGAGTSDNPYLVEDFADLTILSSNNSYWASGTYIQQTGVIDASESSTSNGGEGFIPIGNSSSPFFGHYDGQDFEIQNLTIDRSSNDQGLFGFCINASISNVSLVNVDINGNNKVAGLVGQSQTGLTINNCSVQGSVSGIQYVGGIAGLLGNSTITNSTMDGSVTGDNTVAGCVASATNTTIHNCSSAGSVSRLSENNSKLYWGGIVAFSNFNSDISHCTSSATITGNYYSGGIGGYLASTSLDYCYASGDVIGGTRTGGLIGNGYQLIYVKDSFASGNVTSYDQTVGGFAGSIDGTSSSPAVIRNCYALGDIEGGAFVSGFISGASNVDIDNCYSIGEPTTIFNGAPRYGFSLANGSCTCDNSFWDTTNSNTSTSNIGIGHTTEEMKTLSTFTNATWDFLGESINGDEDHWSMDAGKNSGYPYLTWAEDLVPVTIVCPHVTVSQPEDGQRNIDLEEGNILWNEISHPPFYQTRYEITIKNPDEEIVYEDDISNTGISLGNAGLVYSTKYTYTVMPYFLAEDNSKVYPETDPYIYTFYTYAGIVVEEENQNNPVSEIKIDIPDGALPSNPVIPGSLPTNLPYQSLAAFSYNFDVTGSYGIEFYSDVFTLDWYMNSPHIYANGVELTMVEMKGNVESGMWAIAGEGFVYLLINYDNASKGDVDVVVTNNVEQTLPVELSSFNAIATADNFAQISWETASESNLLGYNIYRNERENSETSQRVNTNIISANNYASGSKYSFVDSEIETETTYYYWLESVELSNENKLYGPVSVRIESELNNNVLPTATSLFAAYPNPFNPETTINFNVKENDMASLVIYNLKGQVVKSYTNFLPGQHSLVWNAKDNNNKNVTSGVYLYKLISNSYNKTNKMILMK